MRSGATRVMLGILLVLAQAETPAACGDSSKDCGFLFHGPYVANGQVVDDVLVSCTVPPKRHVLDAYMERQHGAEWFDAPGVRHVVTALIPDSSGFTRTVSGGPCQDGWYRAVAHSSGEGPPPSDHPDGPGQRFTYVEAGPPAHITARDCAGGS